MLGSFNYLVPALFLNLTVLQVKDLGNLSTGGEQGLGVLKDGRLYSEPGFEPSFKGTVMYGTDYVTIDPTGDDVTRPDLSLTVFPDDGATPFEMLATGIQIASPEVASITSGNLSEGRKVPYGGIYSIFVPTFRGGYAELQNSVFVGSETVSDSSTPGEFLVGIKISKVFPVKTNITIGEEFP